LRSTKTKGQIFKVVYPSESQVPGYKNEGNKLKKNYVNLVHFSSRPGGIEMILPVIITAMPGYAFKSFVIHQPAPDDVNVYDMMQIPVVYGKGIRARTFLQIFRFAKENKDQIFQVFNIGPFFLLVLRLAGLKKIVYSIHGTIYWKKSGQKFIHKLIWTIALKRSYIITSNTEYSKKVFLDKIKSRAAIQVLHNPIDGTRFSPYPLPLSHDGLKIIYAGRLSRGKNLEKWIDFAVGIHKTIPDSQFEIYGTGSLHDILKNKIRLLNAGHFILLKGFREDIENAYREADVLLFLSEYESFGNVVVECILSGTPVIVSDIPSIQEIFREFPEFIIATSDQMLPSIISKIHHINDLKKTAMRARGEFISRFSTENHIRILNGIYQSLYAKTS
jgi:glycosyltransferase involved in cell wall biosynthesis